MDYLLAGLLNIAFNMVCQDHVSGCSKINHLDGFTIPECIDIIVRLTI